MGTRKMTMKMMSRTFRLRMASWTMTMTRTKIPTMRGVFQWYARILGDKIPKTIPVIARRTNTNRKESRSRQKM